MIDRYPYPVARDEIAAALPGLLHEPSDPLDRGLVWRSRTVSGATLLVRAWPSDAVLELELSCRVPRVGQWARYQLRVTHAFAAQYGALALDECELELERFVAGEHARQAEQGARQHAGW